MFLGCQMGCRDVRVINPEHLGIPVWVCIVTHFRRPHHNVATAVGINRIPITTDVVRGVVNGELFRRKDRVVDNSNGVSFIICKQAGVITIKAFPKKPAEEVNAKLKDKILGPMSGC